MSNFSIGDLLAPLGGTPEKPPVEPPTPAVLLASPYTSRTAREEIARRDQFVVEGRPVPPHPDPHVENIIGAKTPEELASRISRVPQDPIHAGATSGWLNFVGRSHPGGFSGLKADLAKVSALHARGELDDPETTSMLEHARSNIMSEDEYLGLAKRIQDVGDLVDASPDPAVRSDSGARISVSRGPLGPVMHADFDEPNTAMQATLASEPSLTIGKATGSRFGLRFNLGRFSVSAQPSETNASVLRHLYASVSDGSDVMWLQGRPRAHRDVEALRKQLQASEVGFVGELWLNGEHPAMTPGTHVVVDLPPKTRPQMFSQFGNVRKLGTVLRQVVDRNGEIAGQRVDRVLVTLEDGSPSKAARGMVALGAAEPVVYGSGSPGEGWKRVREHFYTDGLATYAHRSDDPEWRAEHGFEGWVRNSSRVNKDLLPRQEGELTFRRQADGSFDADGWAKLVGNASFKLPQSGNVAKATSEAGPLTGLEVDSAGPVPVVRFLFGDAEPTGAVAAKMKAGKTIFETGDETENAKTFPLLRLLGFSPVLRTQGREYLPA